MSKPLSEISKIKCYLLELRLIHNADADIWYVARGGKYLRVTLLGNFKDFMPSKYTSPNSNDCVHVAARCYLDDDRWS